MNILANGFGVGIPHQRAENDSDWYDLVLRKLNPPWFYNWKYDLLGKYNNYVPMIWRCNTEWINRAIPIVKSHPKQLYLLGNEPEPEQPGQSNTTPEDFIAGVRMWRKQVGYPFAAPGICWGEYGRRWLDRYLELGGPLPDVWHFHIYAYSMESVGAAILDMKRLYPSRPIIISECAGAVKSVDKVVMDGIRLACTREDIQAGAWFSAYYETWEEPSLLTKDGELTELGIKYISGLEEVYLPMIVT